MLARKVTEATSVPHSTRTRRGGPRMTSRLHAGLSQRPSRKGFRADIEGLRAVAVLLVMLSHAGVPFLRGGFVGVDVFFVISGFLITGRIRDEIRATGKFSLRRFYAARIERLLPAATLTLYAVLAMTLLFLPRIRWRDTVYDLAASAAYFVNWRFADRATDYFGSDDAPSAVLHYWSLSVEEQYYLIWPLLLLALILVARARRWSAKRLWWRMLIVLGAITFASLIWSIVYTVRSPAAAYFVTTTRLWELGIGSALAIAVMRLKPPHEILRHIMIWGGLAAIVVAALLFDGSTGFPGYAALLPTLATAALLYAGSVETKGSLPMRWLTSPSMQSIGALSYSLYLWHWPLLVVFAAKFGELNVFFGLCVVVLSFIPAYFAYRYFEQPIRKRRWLRDHQSNAILAAVVCLISIVVPSLLVGGVMTKSAASQAPQNKVVALETITNGATVLWDDPIGDPRGAPVDQVPSIVPDPANARDDTPNVNGCFNTAPQTLLDRCEFGDRNSKTKVVLVGDSHAAQWLPAVNAIAAAKGWHLVVFGKSACPFLETTVLGNRPGQPYAECAEWNKAAREFVTTLRPALIITTSFRFTVMQNGKPLLSTENSAARVKVMRSSWANLTQQTGARVVVLRDTPMAPFDVADCVSGNMQQLTKCAFDREQAVEGFGPDQVAAASGLERVHLLDLNDAICPMPQCAPVIGGVLIYRDRDHLTATYASSLAPRMLKALESLTTQ